jgi:hypothetical protein
MPSTGSVQSATSSTAVPKPQPTRAHLQPLHTYHYSRLETVEQRQVYTLAWDLDKRPKIPLPTPAHLEPTHVNSYNMLKTEEERQAYITTHGLEQPPPILTCLEADLEIFIWEDYEKIETNKERQAYISTHDLSQAYIRPTRWIFYRDAATGKRYLIHCKSDKAHTYYTSRQNWSDEEIRAFFIANAEEVRGY